MIKSTGLPSLLHSTGLPLKKQPEWQRQLTYETKLKQQELVVLQVLAGLPPVALEEPLVVLYQAVLLTLLTS